MIPLAIGQMEKDALADLRKLASAHPVDVRPLPAKLATVEGKQAHMKQMTAQTIDLPTAFQVTYSIETNHPDGNTYRHMSMSVSKAGRVPSIEAVWMVCEELGFVGGLTACTIYMEELKRGIGPAQAVNVMQPVSVVNA